jgi:hypothetical protein
VEFKASSGPSPDPLLPEELMKSWTSFGLSAQGQFRRLMEAAVTTAKP